MWTYLYIKSLFLLDMLQLSTSNLLSVPYFTHVLIFRSLSCLKVLMEGYCIYYKRFVLHLITVVFNQKWLNCIQATYYIRNCSLFYIICFNVGWLSNGETAFTVNVIFYFKLTVHFFSKMTEFSTSIFLLCSCKATLLIVNVTFTFNYSCLF